MASHGTCVAPTSPPPHQGFSLWQPLPPPDPSLPPLQKLWQWGKMKFHNKGTFFGTQTPHPQTPPTPLKQSLAHLHPPASGCPPTMKTVRPDVQGVSAGEWGAEGAGDKSRQTHSSHQLCLKRTRSTRRSFSGVPGGVACASPRQHRLGPHHGPRLSCEVGVHIPRQRLPCGDGDAVPELTGQLSRHTPFAFHTASLDGHASPHL